MPKKPPSYRTHAEGLPPLYLTPTEVGDTPRPQKYETNPIPARPTANRQQPKAVFTKRTQFAPPPIVSPTQKRETNPIYPHNRPANTQKMRNEPKKTTPDAIGPPLYLTPTEVGETPTIQKMRNEPNLRLPQLGPRSKNAKRTQFTAGPRPKCETNPIYPHRRHLQSTIPFPNPRSAAHYPSLATH